MKAFGTLLLAAIGLAFTGAVPFGASLALLAVGVVLFALGSGASAKGAGAQAAAADDEHDELLKDQIAEEDALHGFYNQHSWKYDSND